MKKLYIFDLDGTVSPSKSPIESPTASLMCTLLAHTNVAIITGSSYFTIESRFLNGLPCGSSAFHHLYLLPTNGAVFYAYQEGEFGAVYENRLSEEEKQHIFEAFKDAMDETHFEMPPHLYGIQIEDRETQITFSALGQDAPLAEKELWDPDQAKRRVLQDALIPKLPAFEVRIGGATSIDVTRKGVDKAFAIRQVLEHLGLGVEDAIFVGDALYEGGNDAAAKETGIETVAVSGPPDTRRFIEGVLEELHS